ncbi:hypothetical protein NE235_25465 [Actinoallomurus spadix]|uniref:Uncharacterized protein n=1 Tax=Actinoallomurus spadix TaxID=79912 RepID=A0ABN0X3W8_9ACTN|nr:hypothetical protein [Actinoallomurus spadix]MCO5989462.1 hypothetical protein [Actinoallomurus spadix]
MNPRWEAWDLLGGEYDVRVLEPSPPAVTTPPWYADDPLAGPYGAKLVTPLCGLGRSWDDLARERPELAGFCADRWLGAWRRLAPLPRDFAATRRTLHALAEHVVAAARHAANGRIGLRFTRGGFGTPYFGDDRQLRVENGRLVVGDAVASPETLADAARLAGVPLGMPPDAYFPRTPADPALPLTVSPPAAEALGAWYGFAWSVLEQLRFDARALGPGRVQLWPEHFDAAVDLGDEATGRRAAFGASPGDAQHPEPYLYVAPWAKRKGAYWNDDAFGGASLPYAALLTAGDQRATALGFLRRGLDTLKG